MISTDAVKGKDLKKKQENGPQTILISMRKTVTTWYQGETHKTSHLNVLITCFIYRLDPVVLMRGRNMAFGLGHAKRLFRYWRVRKLTGAEWASLCFSRFLRILKPFEHRLQTKGFSPVWKRRWALRLFLRRKPFLQCGQTWGLSPVWKRSCLRRLFRRANVFLHFLHEYGFSPVWKRSWRFRIFLRLNFLPQILQTWACPCERTPCRRQMPFPHSLKQHSRRPVWTRWCARRSFGVEKHFLLDPFALCSLDSIRRFTSCTEHGRNSLQSKGVWLSWKRTFFAFAALLPDAWLSSVASAGVLLDWGDSVWGDFSTDSEELTSIRPRSHWFILSVERSTLGMLSRTELNGRDSGSTIECEEGSSRASSPWRPKRHQKREKFVFIL